MTHDFFFIPLPPPLFLMWYVGVQKMFFERAILQNQPTNLPTYPPPLSLLERMLRRNNK